MIELVFGLKYILSEKIDQFRYYSEIQKQT